MPDTFDATVTPVDRDTWLDGWMADEPDGTLKRIVQELRMEAAIGKPAPILPPSPDQVALAFCQALLTRPDLTSEAAIGKAWTAVPEFYRERWAYPDFARSVLFGATPQTGAPPPGETGATV